MIAAQPLLIMCFLSGPPAPHKPASSQQKRLPRHLEITIRHRQHLVLDVYRVLRHFLISTRHSQNLPLDIKTSRAKSKTSKNCRVDVFPERGLLDPAIGSLAILFLAIRFLAIRFLAIRPGRWCFFRFLLFQGTTQIGKSLGQIRIYFYGFTPVLDRLVGSIAFD